MIGIVVVTHGSLAPELVNAARQIVGEIPAIAAVSIGWADDVNVAIKDGYLRSFRDQVLVIREARRMVEQMAEFDASTILWKFRKEICQPFIQ